MSIKGNQEKIPRPRPLFISDMEDYLSNASLNPLKYDGNIYPPVSPTKIGLEKYTYTRYLSSARRVEPRMPECRLTGLQLDPCDES